VPILAQTWAAFVKARPFVRHMAEILGHMPNDVQEGIARNRLQARGCL
jgi:hypothetical protein